MAKEFYKKYQHQKWRAEARGIDWQFTYDEWLVWWGADITLRGRQSGDLVMARIGDVGPYSPANCVKLTCNKNISDAQTNKQLSTEHLQSLSKYWGKPHTTESKLKISQANLGKAKHTDSSKALLSKLRSKRIVTPWGEFSSLKAAAAAKNISPQCLNGWIRRAPENYQYKEPV